MVLNVTATETEAPGFVTAYPCDVAMPTASNLNYERGLTVPNLVTVPISADGRMCLFTRAAAHLVVVDAEAWFGPAGAAGYEALTPTRALDTRVSITEAPYGIGTVAKIAAGLHVPLSLHDRFGVPSDATAVVLNVTVTDPNAAGYLTVYPCDQPRPTASNLNYERNQTVANQVTVALSTNLAVIAPGTVCLFTQQTTNLVVDVAGYYTTTPEQNWAVELT